MHFSKLLLIILLLFAIKAYGQQDVDFHLNAHLLSGKKVLKVKRDFHDPYLWALTTGNGVYRINSINLQVDDYTSVFAGYSNLQFVDIAGRSQDTVFVATNSTNVIEYKKGVLRTIGPPDGISGTINEVGMDHIYEKYGYAYNGNLYGLPVLLIATTDNIWLYDAKNEVISSVTVQDQPGNNHLYETTYRSEAYSNVGWITYDPARETVLTSRTDYTIYGGDMWFNTPEFGNHIYTGYYTVATYQDKYLGVYNDDLALDQLWGTENGLFENNRVYSFTISTEYKHYLTGIKVNKVTSIYGLVSFGSEDPNGITKENLLVGTDKGFYFSSSGYFKYVQGWIRDYNTFTFDTEIGNQIINDVCVNATSYTTTVCEDGVWVAATDGLYYLKPDWGKYVNPQLAKAATFKDMDNTITSVNICAESSVTAQIDNNIYNGNAIQWYKDGAELLGESKSTLSISSAGDYYAVLYDPCSIVHLETNHLTVSLISAPVFSFNYPDKIEFCDGTASTVLKTDNNPGYQYRWYTNGVLNGGTDFQYTVKQSGKYKVEVSACTDSWVPSKEVEVDLVNLPVPVITADKSKYCAGDNATLTVSTSADPGYSINWYKDGNLIAASQNQTSIIATTDGNYSVTIKSNIASCTQTSNLQQVAFTPAPVFTFNYPDELRYCSGTPVTLKAQGSAAYQYRWYKDGTLTGDTGPSLSITQTGKYQVDVSACDGSWMPSKEVQVDIISIPVPVIVADKPAYCIGDNAVLSLSVDIDPGYTINWYKDNTLLSAYTNQTSISSTDAGSYTVSITDNQANSDGIICSQTSAVQPIVFNPPPTVSIQKIVRTTLCSGQTVDLKASYSTGAISWSTGDNAAQISVTQSGTYKVTVTSAAGCTSDANVDILFFSNPVLNIPDATVCVPSHKTITLTAPERLASYSWNGQAGTNTYVADHPQKVTLKVTDANGCQATQDIQIGDECPDVKISNAFTPNGDGINDTWAVTGLEYDQTALVKIFTRYGQQVYLSKGYGVPWNGEYQGKKLPTGAYYYIINAKNGTQTYSGEVTIIN
jgi:gliding motility-associated-like protein